MNESYNNTPTLPPKIVVQNPVLRWILITFGWVLVAIGIIGVFIPVLPTTVFLIGAVWAFTRSSRRFQKWLWYHPTFGTPLQDWYAFRVIPIKAKILAVFMMMLSVTIMVFFYQDNLLIPLYMTGAFIPIALYICSRASVRPQ